MKKTVFLICFPAFACTEPIQKKESINAGVENICFNYPPVIVSAKLEDLYDSARWSIYCQICDTIYLPKDTLSKNNGKAYGMLSLKFMDVKISNDRATFYFKFMDGDKELVWYMTKNLLSLSAGVTYDLKSKRKEYMIAENGLVRETGSLSRFVNPMQPEVVSFIKKNWDKLDPCFRELAEKHRLRKL